MVGFKGPLDPPSQTLPLLFRMIMTTVLEANSYDTDLNLHQMRGPMQGERKEGS